MRIPFITSIFTQFHWHIIVCLFCLSACNSQVAKMNRISYRAPFMTQLGSFTQGHPGTNAGNEFCEDIKVDRQENIICVGTTDGKFGARHFGGNDAVVAKLNKDGELLWTYQTGGLGVDEASGLAVDEAGNIYIAGNSDILEGPFIHGERGGMEAFVMKISPTGELLWYRLFGTTGTDACNSLTIGKSGDVYCAGNTTGGLGKLANGSRETNDGGTDIFVIRLNGAGDLVWISQLGANTLLKWKDGTTTATKTGEDKCLGVVVDKEEKNVYCSGSTTSNLGESNGSFSLSTSKLDAIILRLDAATGQNPRVFQLGHYYKLFGQGTVRGPEENDSCRKITITPDGHLWCVGITSGNLAAPFQGGVNDAFLMKVSPDFESSKVVQIGTNQHDRFADIVADRMGNVYLTGSTHGSIVETNDSPGVHEHPLVAKFNSNAERIWIRELGVESLGAGSHGDNRCTGVALDSDNNVYCSGKVNRDVAERNGSYPTFNDDIFFWRLDSEGRY